MIIGAFLFIGGLGNSSGIRCVRRNYRRAWIFLVSRVQTSLAFAYPKRVWRSHDVEPVDERWITAIVTATSSQPEQVRRLAGRAPTPRSGKAASTSKAMKDGAEQLEARGWISRVSLTKDIQDCLLRPSYPRGYWWHWVNVGAMQLCGPLEKATARITNSALAAFIEVYILPIGNRFACKLPERSPKNTWLVV